MTASTCVHPARLLREPEVRRDGWWCWCVGCRLWVRIGRDGRVRVTGSALKVREDTGDYTADMDWATDAHGHDIRNGFFRRLNESESAAGYPAHIDRESA